MAGRNLKFSAVLQLNSKARAFTNKVAGTSEAAMRKVLKEAEKLAKQNVEPGVGPSPHTGKPEWGGHNYPYRDTGDLQDSVQSAIWLQGFLTEGSVFTDLDYGAHLEVGWRTRAGNFYRYPWLKPAFLEAMRKLPALAAAAFRTQMVDLGEDRITDEAELDSWASAAERWAKDMKALKAKVEAPDVPPPYEPHATDVARYLQRRAQRKRQRREELGPELPSDRSKRRRVTKKDRMREASEGYDPDLVKKTHRTGEERRRASLDPEKVRAQYEARTREREVERERKRKAREAHRKLEAANRALEERMKISLRKQENKVEEQQAKLDRSLRPRDRGKTFRDLRRITRKPRKKKP